MWVVISVILFLSSCQNSKEEKNGFITRIPYVETDNAVINSAYRMAIGDLFTNIRDFQVEIDIEPKPVIVAGLDYNRS